MKGIRIATALLVATPAMLPAQGPLRVADLKISDPTRIVELDMDKLKGQPFRLAWSPDGSQFYVQTLEGTYADANTGRSNAKMRHYLFSSTPGGSKKDLQGPPDWFAEYWNAKNGQYPPGAPSLRIDVKTEQRKKSTTAAPMGGDLAKGGLVAGDAGTSAGDVSAAAAATQMVAVNTMVYKGEKIGEFVNSVIVPGLTYGWGPKGTNVLAFAEVNSGKVVIIDEQGKKLAIDGSKDAVLPAWSSDGTRLAWLQKDGKKKFPLFVATVSGS
jgi:WD40-like Beta Propeller Repeat